MTIKQLQTGVLGVNTYLVINQEVKQAIVIDPGGDADYILRTLKESGATLKAIFLTHCHFDHIGGVAELLQMGSVPVYASDACKANVNTSVNLARAMMGIDLLPITVTNVIKDGETVTVAEISIQAIYTPGHTSCSCCYLIENALFSGDTLFFRSIGRTDFPTGSYEQLVRSVKEKLYVLLPNNYSVYSGHGEKTTLRSEQKNNPYTV